jgi:hypothetical protein
MRQIGAGTSAGRAMVAAQAAKRLLERGAAADTIAPHMRQHTHDRETCVFAVDRLATRFAVGIDSDDPGWRTAWTTVANLNLRSWQRCGDATCAEQSLLMVVLEAVLNHELAHSGMQFAGEPHGAGTSVLADQADSALEAALVLTNNAPDVALHVLIGVALRAMSEMSTGDVRLGRLAELR